MINITDLCTDKTLFAPWFKRPQEWQAWFAFLQSVFGQPLLPNEQKIYEACTGRKIPLTKPVREAWLVVGRRGGKSMITSLIATYLACLSDWQPYLVPGERATVMIIASNRAQARVVFRYISSFFAEIPKLKEMLEKPPTVNAIDLKNRVTIEIHTANFRSIRGYTIGAVLMDEIAFWRDDTSANPDEEIIAALRPGMSTIPNSMLLGLSSPYARRGVLYKTWKEYYGEEDPETLVWQADTRTMNPTIPQKWIDRQYRKDPANAAAEYGAQFRADIEALFTEELIEACTMNGVRSLDPLPHTSYIGFTDPSGGGNDSFTLAVAHLDKGRMKVVLDRVLEEVPPFSPDEVVKRFTDVLKHYGISRVIGDRYAGEWPRERFRAHGIAYEVSEQTRSELYLNMLSAMNSNQMEMLDNSTLRTQLMMLDRHTSKLGKDRVDHPLGAHDDVANAVAGAMVQVMPHTENWDSSHLHVGEEIKYGGYVTHSDVGLPSNWNDELNIDW